MATAERKDPFRGFNFKFECEGIEAGFSDISGLTSDGDVAEYREGNDKDLYVRKLTGLRKFSNLTLKRGITKNLDLWDWRQKILDGQTDRRDGAVILMDEEQNAVARWEFTGGWIHKIEGPTLNAKGNDITVESVEIVIESLRRIKV
jgi:phage tail-like protein